jgi:hypothetical protein
MAAFSAAPFIGPAIGPLGKYRTPTIESKIAS